MSPYIFTFNFIKMDVLLTKTIVNNSTIIEDTSTYVPTRSQFASFLFFNNKRTKENVSVDVSVGNHTTDYEWSFNDLKDGVYKAELVVIPLFSYLVGEALTANNYINKGVITYYNGKFYNSFNIINTPSLLNTPDLDYNNWEEVESIKEVENIFTGNDNTLYDYEKAFYGSLEFVYYNNIILKFLNLSKTITSSCDICNNPKIEELRCLRDKYESIELAAAASNFLIAQTIIESSENLVTSCSC